MRRRAGLIIILAVVLLIIGVFVVWPAVDRQLMRVPMTDGISALRSGDMPALRECFTPGAVVYIGDIEMPAMELFDKIAPYANGRSDRSSGSFRFAGYANTQRNGRVVKTDFRIIYEMNAGEENPYRVNPTVEQRGQVTLEKQGLFTWKITRIGIGDNELSRRLKRLGVLPGVGDK